MELDDLLAASEILCVNLALTDDTRGLLDAKRLGLLPRGAIVVDASRGGVVDLDALIDLVESRPPDRRRDRRLRHRTPSDGRTRPRLGPDPAVLARGRDDGAIDRAHLRARPRERGTSAWRASRSRASSTASDRSSSDGG